MVTDTVHCEVAGQAHYEVTSDYDGLQTCDLTNGRQAEKGINHFTT